MPDAILRVGVHVLLMYYLCVVRMIVSLYIHIYTEGVGCMLFQIQNFRIIIILAHPRALPNATTMSPVNPNLVQCPVTAPHLSVITDMVASVNQLILTGSRASIQMCLPSICWIPLIIAFDSAPLGDCILLCSQHLRRVLPRPLGLRQSFFP